ncbi:hypothetical protein KM043_015087 [Ampulex compressa]|nr:hypothetical protein KM043_015087 [Ampulex compressa]
MGHRSSIVVLLLVLLDCSLWQAATAMGSLKVAFQWKQLEYQWPSNDTKRLFPDYKEEDNLPLGLEVTNDRIFVTVPRWRQGVAASLNYININDTRESPPLNPYPSWEAHQYGAAGVPEIVSTFRIRADRCDRLFVLDTGLTDILGSPEQQAPPALIVYDTRSDEMLRKFVIPADQRTPDSLFANIAVEDYSCEDTYVYLGDLGGPGLVVYSWKLDKSWLVKHHFFHPDPQGGEFNVSGISFQWTDGLFGMALESTNDGYSTMYFHPLSSSMEFSVSTKLLRDPERAESSEIFHEFHARGSRGPNGQSSVSFLDPGTGVLFYALTNLNAIACWKPQSKFEIHQQGYVYVDNVTMVFPNDLKVDRNGNLWVLSDRLPAFMYSHLDPDDYNFRILTGPTKDVIRGTVCSMEEQSSTTRRTEPGPSSPETRTRMPEATERTPGSGAASLVSALILVLLGTISTLFVTTLEPKKKEIVSDKAVLNRSSQDRRQELFGCAYEDHYFEAGGVKNRGLHCRSIRKKGNMQKIQSSIPGLASPRVKNAIITTNYDFLTSRKIVDGAEGLWRIRDGLYDLENFVKTHPGGSEWIRLSKGTDITEAFECHHLTEAAEKLLPKFYVRDALTPRSMPFTFHPDGFYRVFKKRAVEALKDVDFHAPSKKSNLIADFLVIATFALCLLTAAKQSIAAVFLAGAFLTWTAIAGHNYFHMRDNFRMYYFDLTLMSSKQWRISHVLSHHLYPNTIWDREIFAVEIMFTWFPDKNKSTIVSFLRQVFGPIFYSVLYIADGVFGRFYAIFFQSEKCEFRDIVPFFVPFSMYLVAPSFLVVLRLWISILLISSIFFGMIGFNGAHHHPDIFHDGDVYRKDMDWGLLELDAARDRKIVDDSAILALTNFGSHVLHHILPTVDHCYLPLCVPAFLQTCKDFGIENERWSPWELIKGQFKQIARTEAAGVKHRGLHCRSIRLLSAVQEERKYEKNPKLDTRRIDDGAEGLWRIRDGLYDLENFIKTHPGGAEWIRLTKGTDITEAFECHHLTERAEKLLPKFYVRDAVTPRVVPFTFHPDGFYRVFKKRALEALKDVNFHAPSKKSNLIADFLVTTTFVLCLLTAAKQSITAAFLAGVFLAWTAIIGHNYFHMRDNFRMYYFDLSLMSSKDWRISHAMSHHLYPNTIWDREIFSMDKIFTWLPDKDKSPIMSFLRQIFAPLYWSLLFVVGGILGRFYAILYESEKYEFRDIVPFFVPFSMYLVAPSFLVILKFWLVILIISSVIFGVIGFNAAHHHPDIFHDGDVYRKDMDWGLLEIDAVRDRKIIDDCAFLALTNFGSHTLHHMLPTVDHSYLPLCIPAFLQTCKEFGIENEKWSQWELIKGQFKQIARTEAKHNYRKKPKEENEKTR